ncbi:ATP-binding protein [Piscinibacter sakaiensis]|uniref:ATP-binding protein n=1 Tax=Piscinibacter sakaiensis TaxID=1547922 RepID=UPI003AAF6288
MTFPPPHPAAVAPTAPASPRLLLAVLADDEAPRLVEAAFRLHQTLGGSWSVVGLDTLETESRAARHRACLLDALTEAERRGARVSRISTGSHAPSAAVEALIHRARSAQATMLVIGRSRLAGSNWTGNRTRLSDFTDMLSQSLPEVTLHVVALPGEATVPVQRRWQPRLPGGWITVLATLSACTALAAWLETQLHPDGLITIYLAGIVFIASRSSKAATLTAAAAAIALYDLLFVAPRWSLKPADPEDYLAFALMLATGWLVSHLGAGMRDHARMAEARARRAQAQSELALGLVGAGGADAVGAALADALQSSLQVRACMLVAADREAQRVGIRHEEMPEPDPTLAATVLASGRDAGAGTEIEPGAPLRYLPLRVGDEALGVLALQPLPAGRDSLEDWHLVRALANQAALGLDRARTEQRRVQAAIETERERLRNTLLAGLSHDFRTPLTTIVGSATTLLEQGGAIDEQHRRALLESLLQQARRLNVMTSNLLDMTRLQEGAIALAPEWCPADELLAEAEAAVRPILGRRRLDLHADPEALVWCDPRLIGQLLVNLLDNAVRHTGERGHIQMAVDVGDGRCTLTVRDDGPGIPPGEEQRIFRKFHRAGDGRDGASRGLGLAICAAVAELHGATISARNDGGARFEILLPQPARPQLDDGETR